MNQESTNSTMTTVIAVTLVIVIVYTFLGAFLGLMATMDARANQGRDGCIYRSLLAYVNPGYLGICELARARFNIEQPVEYVPSDTQELKSE